VVSRPFKGRMISVKRVVKTRRVLVRGARRVTNDYISLYFEKHAGTDVTDIQQMDDHVLITFADFEGDAHILVLHFTTRCYASMAYGICCGFVFLSVHPIHFYQNRPTPFPGQRS